jgi:hypothetical protein
MEPDMSAFLEKTEAFVRDALELASKKQPSEATVRAVTRKVAEAQWTEAEKARLRERGWLEYFERKIIMPSKSKSQHRLMEAAAHTKGGYGGVPQKVGREFVRADKGRPAPKPVKKGK